MVACVPSASRLVAKLLTADIAEPPHVLARLAAQLIFASAACYLMQQCSGQELARLLLLGIVAWLFLMELQAENMLKYTL